MKWRRHFFGAGAEGVTSQSSVLPVLSIDTMSQQLVVVFGVSALWVWWRWLHTSTGSGARFVLSILLLSLSFGAKESALGVSLAFVLLAGIHVWNRPERWGRTLLGLAPAIGVTLSYVIYRSTLPVRLGTFGEGRYDLHLGLNIPVNALQLVAGTIVPFPTSWLYKLSQDVGSWLAFGIISASSAVILAVMVRYRPAAGEVRPWLILILPLVLSTPVIVLNHVSELYTYTLLPFVGLIAGAAFGRGIRIEKGATRGFLIGLLAILLVAQSVSSVYKANQLHRNGEISRSLFLDLEEHVVHAPQYSTFRLCADEIVPDRYSSFIMGPLDTVFGGLRSVLDYYGRSDLRLHPTTRCDDAPEPYDPDLEVRLWFDGTRGRFHCSTSTNSRRTQACPSSNHLLPLPIVEENP